MKFPRHCAFVDHSPRIRNGDGEHNIKQLYEKKSFDLKVKVVPSKNRKKCKRNSFRETSGRSLTY